MWELTLGYGIIKILHLDSHNFTRFEKLKKKFHLRATKQCNNK